MNIASIASLLSTFQAQGSSAANQQSAGVSTADSQLLAALAQSNADSDSSDGSLLQTLVTLSSQAQTATDQSAMTYTAQGLLTQIQSTLNDPLLQSGDASSDGGADGSTNSALNSLLSAGTGAANTGSSSAAGAAGSSTDWVTILRQNPALAPVVAQSLTDQSLINALT